jgi:hypothetical protein
VGLQPADLIRGHPRAAAQAAPVSTDARHKAGQKRFG